jgi:hypothetical protein
MACGYWPFFRENDAARYALSMGSFLMAASSALSTVF